MGAGTEVRKDRGDDAGGLGGRRRRRHGRHRICRTLVLMLLSAAIAYARHGIPVLPVHTAVAGNCSCGRNGCDRPGKHPRLRHGLTEATTDPLRLEMWW